MSQTMTAVFDAGRDCDCVSILKVPLSSALFRSVSEKSPSAARLKLAKVINAASEISELRMVALGKCYPRWTHNMRWPGQSQDATGDYRKAWHRLTDAIGNGRRTFEQLGASVKQWNDASSCPMDPRLQVPLPV